MRARFRNSKVDISEIIGNLVDAFLGIMGVSLLIGGFVYECKKGNASSASMFLGAAFCIYLKIDEVSLRLKK